MYPKHMQTELDEQIRSVASDRLTTIEREEDARVLFACESGSRAWGFASANSDYDVRFIYLRRPEWSMTRLTSVVGI